MNSKLISVEKDQVVKTYTLETDLFSFFLSSGYYQLKEDCGSEHLSLPDFVSFEIFEEFLRLVREEIDFNYPHLEELVKWLDNYSNHPCKHTFNLIDQDKVFLQRLYDFELGKSKCLIAPSQDLYNILLKDSTFLAIQYVTVKTGEMEFGILLNAGVEGKYVTSAYDRAMPTERFLEERSIWSHPEYTSILDPELFVMHLSTKKEFHSMINGIDQLMWTPMGPIGPRGLSGPMNTHKYDICSSNCCNIFCCHSYPTLLVACNCLAKETSDTDVSSCDGVSYANTVAKYLYTTEMFTFTDEVVKCTIKPLNQETKDRVLACLLSVQDLDKYSPITTYTIPYKGKSFTTNVRLGFVRVK